MYAVETPNGNKTYFNRGMCGVFENPLLLAKKCADKCSGIVLVETSSKYRFTKNGEDIFPRYRKLENYNENYYETT